MTRTKGPRYYRTEKTASQFVGEIMTLLSEFKAQSFHVSQEDGVPVAIAFVLNVGSGGMPFRVAPNLDGIRRRLEEVGQLGRVKNIDAVAWAQTRHLLELQLEAIENGVARPAEVFGGYALTSSGCTVAEMLEERVAELMPGESLLLAAPAE